MTKIHLIYLEKNITMNENDLTLRRKKGIVKMIGIIVNMIQDHKIDDTYTINGRKYLLKEISDELKGLVKSTMYDDYEKEFLNEVRNLVLSYKEKDREEFKSQWPSHIDLEHPSTWDDEITWAM